MRRWFIVPFITLGAILLALPLSHAETKVLTAEATYIMGDGETPDFAEARALQKAKQNALEEAGTYVQSYTKVQNLDLTTEEIQTVAGGVLQVEILENTRRLVKDGLRIYTKIRAMVTTDKMEELARRIKGENVTREYIKLQAEYARLSRELENWKQRAATTPQGQERKAALDQIREGEKAFERVQGREADLVQRLVSGKKLVVQASRDKEIVDELIQTILTSGYIVTIGGIEAVTDSLKPNMLAVKVPLTIRFSEVVEKAVSHAADALDGSMQSGVEGYQGHEGFEGWLHRETHGPDKFRIQTETRDVVTVALVRIGKHPETARYFQDEVSKLALLVTFLDDTNAPSSCLLGHSKFRSSSERLRTSDAWFQLRRIFPIFSMSPIFSIMRKSTGDSDFQGVRVSKTSYSIDNGRYERPPSSTERNPETAGYVGIVRDEATFVAQYWLPAQTVRNLTGVNVSAILLDESYGKRVREGYEHPGPMCSTTLP